MTCSISECPKEVLARGWCSEHYGRWQRTGQPLRRPQPTPAERFWAKVDKSGDCWEWRGSRFPKGYGQVRSLGERMAHRLAYVLAVGPIADGLTIDHLCRNKICVNPAHLEPVTMRVNNLRSDNASAINARKTHCLRGHELSPENVRIRRADGGRECRECGRTRNRLWWRANCRAA